MNKKGFTLIELLAVIIILGILMIIAIPSVTKYISDSRKNAYIDTAKEIIAGARNLVNEGKLEMFDTDTTYYIDQECIGTENASKSPYGDFTKAYVVVTYNGKGYDYFWTSVDDAGQGISKITPLDKLDIDKIESDLNNNDIPDSLGVDGRGKYMIIDKEQTNCGKGVATNVSGKVSGETGEEIKNIVCKRATSLHTEVCNASDCEQKHGSKGVTITYGNQTTTQGVLNRGDAFDCDVNGDGIYDSETERFYYISDYYDGTLKSYDTSTAALIYYGFLPNNNVPYCINAGEAYKGPLALLEYLPTSSQWKNVSLKNSNRQILTNSLNNTYEGVALSIFDYSGRVARLLSKGELNACSPGALYDTCEFIVEKTQYSYSYASSELTGIWIESISSLSYSGVITSYNAYNNGIIGNACTYSSAGIKPVIDVPKNEIEY